MHEAGEADKPAHVLVQEPKGQSVLNAKQERFANEYIVDLNATQAAIRAGYSAKTAGQQGFDLLKHPEIVALIETLKANRSERVNVTQDYVLSNLYEVVERCMQRAPVFNPFTGAQDIDDEGRHVWRFDGKNTIAALTLLGKHIAMFSETNFNIDLKKCTREQLAEIAAGKNPIEVLVGAPSQG